MDEYQLAQISIMHFHSNMSQQEIAKSLGVSKMTISRMLQKARESNIVEISVKLPFVLDESITAALTQKYGLHRAFVVNYTSTPRVPLAELLGRVWAFYMGTMRLDNTILGLGVGNTLAHVVRHLVPIKTKQLHIVQLMGGLYDVTSENPITIIQETCRKFEANGTYLTSTATVENKEVRDSLLCNTSMGQRVSELWQQCRMALFGIGAIERGTLLSPDLVSHQELTQLKQAGAVGDVLGHCFDTHGVFIDTQLEKRLVSIPVPLLKGITERVAVAGGEYKVIALRGALLSGLITTFVTDVLTARRLLEN